MTPQSPRRNARRTSRLVASLATAALLVSFAGPAAASGSGSGNGAPAAVRKACLKKVDKRAANLARISAKAAKSKWLTAESAEALAADLEADIAAVAAYRSAVQRAPYAEELLEACRVAFGGTRSIVAVDVRKLAIMNRAGQAESMLADLADRLASVATALEGARVSGDAGDVTAVMAALSEALSHLDAEAAALIAEVLAIAPSDWDSGDARDVLADLRTAVVTLWPVFSEVRSGIAALERML